MKIPRSLHHFVSPKNKIALNSEIPATKKLIWVCEKDSRHEWETTVHNKVKLDTSCPVCSNRKLVVGINDLATTHPELLGFWSKNNQLSPKEVTRSSTLKTLWLCPFKHEYSIRTSVRVKEGHSCPYCHGNKVRADYNSVQALRPDLVEWWDLEKSAYLPTEVTPSSSKRIWGKCPEGHSWETQPAYLTSGRRCPYCSNKKVLVRYNDLASTHPHLVPEWNDSRKQPTEVTSGSDFRASWKCSRNHEWTATVYKRTQQDNPTNCPYCDGKKVAQGEKDLAHLFPETAKEFSNRNNMQANEITAHSAKKVWWECSNGHEWQAPVKSRSKKDGHSCPYCANYYVYPGFNDIATLHPQLAKEWDDVKNASSPSETLGAGVKKYWWKCSKNHSWYANIGNRILRQAGCPVCAMRVSRAETEVADFIKSVLPSAHVRTSVRDIISPKELDIYIPELKMAVEFNGLYWHTEAQGKDRNYHLNKYLACEEQGIKLLQIWEDEWRDKQEIVKSLLKSKLGVDDRERVFARKTSVHVISLSETKIFLNKYHIQGFASGSYYLGLRAEGTDELVAVMVLRKLKDEMYLDRYATSKHVIGGQSKFLKWAEMNLDFSQLVAFADLQVSNGSLYEQTGWTLDKVLKPDYRYLVDGERVHKFNYRLKRFRNDPELLWEDGLTERQLAALNGLERVWDSGKIRYVKKKN